MGRNWRTVSAVPLMPPTRRTQQASSRSSARNMRPQRPAARGPAVVVGQQQQRARALALAPGDDVLRRAPSEQPPRGGRDAGEVEEGEHGGEQDEPGAELGARHREHAADDREDRVDRVADRPGRPHGERLDHDLPPKPPRAAQRGAEQPAAQHPTQAAAARRRRRAPQPRRRCRSGRLRAPLSLLSTWRGRQYAHTSNSSNALGLRPDELIEPGDGGRCATEMLHAFITRTRCRADRTRRRRSDGCQRTGSRSCNADIRRSLPVPDRVRWPAAVGVDQSAKE